MWRDQAKEMYFNQGKKIIDIATELNKTRKTVSSYLSNLPNFEEEKERRKKDNRAKRPEYKKNWEKENRQPNIEAYMLKRQHEIDVAVLSSEKYY